MAQCITDRYYFALGVLLEKLGGVCGLLPKTLTLFMTKICDSSYPVYDLTKNLILNF